MQGLEQRLHQGQWPGIRSVAQRGIRIGVGFHEQPGHAGTHRRARQHRNHFAHTAGRGALPARQLHGMRGVKNHRGKRAHDGQSAHVSDQIVVTEGESAFAQHELVRRNVLHFFDHIAHFPGRHELAFLHVNRFAGLRDRLHKIGLPAQKGRRLDHVHHRRDFVQGGVLVHVGEHRHANFLLDRFQNLEPARQPRAAVGLVRGAVGLVVAALEDVEHVQLLGDTGDVARDLQRQRFGLERVRARNQEQGFINTDFNAAEVHSA